MQKLFEELIKEASNGNVIIDDESWPITFNTKILEEDKEKVYENENNFSTLIIKDEEKFIKLLRKYISIELKKNRKMPKFYKNQSYNKIKWLMAYLFVNASVSDFFNPTEYLKRVIGFLEDNTFDFLDNGIEIDDFLDSKLKIKKEVSPTTMETPNRIILTLVDKTNEELEYNLPSIYYGIDNGTCYIYSLLSPKQKNNQSEEEIKYNKKINRLLYKINTGLKEKEINEYYEYKEGKSNYYPEGNITDVTHSFILSLSIFLSLLKRKNITKVKAVPYLPVRYASRYITANNKKDKTKKEELLKRNNEIQTNATNKFIRTFRRISEEDKSVKIESYPYEVDEFLTLNLSSKSKKIPNQILNDVKIKIKEGL